MTFASILLLFVTIERLAELWLANRNTRALIERGAREIGAAHYPLIVSLHALWLASLWWFGWASEIRGGWLIVFLLLQAMRIWVIITLGRRWTTRIIVLPEAPLIREGPYRHVSHPNYVVVVGEIAVLPLCLGLNWLALGFSIANALVLSVRIRSENRALKGRTDAGR